LDSLSHFSFADITVGVLIKQRKHVMLKTQFSISLPYIVFQTDILLLQLLESRDKNLFLSIIWYDCDTNGAAHLQQQGEILMG
jgi:hypothetical protein